MSAIKTAIQSRLTGGTALTALLPGTASIYSTQAPDKATLPYVVYSLYAGGPENETPKERSNVVYYVRAYSAISQKNADDIDDQLRALLHKNNLTVTGWTNFSLFREEDIETPSVTPANQTIYSSGGLYRIRLEQ
jgi:hypothetical protein